MSSKRRDFTTLFSAARAGDSEAAAALVPAVYEELRTLARQRMSREAAGHTLQATALVNEAFLRLVGINDAHWQDSEHFFRVAAEAMRRVLVDHARSKNRLKRGGGRERVALDDVDVPAARGDVDLLGLDEALDAFEMADPRGCQVVKLRYFMGLSIQETADALDLTPNVVRADWTAGKYWLREFMKRDD